MFEYMFDIPSKHPPTDTVKRRMAEMFKPGATVNLLCVKVRVYHEVQPESLDTVLRDGIKRSTRGEKSDSLVEQVDSYLDSRRPDDVAADGLSRANVIYAYLPYGDMLFDIREGAAVDVKTFAAQRQLLLLQLTVDAKHCFVSDLQLYDDVKSAMKLGDDETVLADLADRYWRKVTHFDHFNRGRFHRPEAMLTCDITPSQITVASPDE
jgi:hypothetical protein